MEYKKSDTYKLLSMGYKEKEVEVIEKKIKKVDTILSMKYTPKLTTYLEEKYFIEENLKEYLSYSSKNIKADSKEVIAIVNVGMNEEIYEKTSKTKTKEKEKMLVNKHNDLGEYIPEDIVPISSKYAYAGNEISNEIYDFYKEMCDAAKEDGITLVATLGYRSYESQKKTYDNYAKKNGDREADEDVIRPGFSEHQTGLALDILALGVSKDNFASSKASAWLIENAYKYGFILRYPEDKEKITGYEYEPWHYRYVGNEIATKIQKEKITFDEYYAYYIQKKSK